MRRVITGLAAAIVLAAAAPALAAPTQDTLRDAAAQFQQAAQLANGGDERGAFAISRRLVAAPDFASYPQELRKAILDLHVALALDLKENAAALAGSAALVALPGADGEDWSLRMMATDDPAEELKALAELARWPDKLSQVNTPFIGQLLFRSGRNPALAAAHRRAVLALAASDWTPAAPQNKDGILYEAALLWLEGGETAKAAEAVRGLLDPPTIIKVRVDRRFDAISASLGDDFKARLEEDLRGAKSQADAKPHSAELQNAWIDLLLREGRAAEALAAVDAVIARDAADPAAWSDKADQWPWVLNSRAWALDQLGRNDEAIRQMQAASALGEQGKTNVSQAINLADMYLLDGRPAEAVAALAVLNEAETTEYGRMEALLVRVCAAADTHDAAAMTASLKAMTPMAGFDPSAYTDALLCAGDQDGAAARTIARLDDPTTRADALVELQDYLPSPNQTPVRRAIDARRAALKARADVQAAANRWGRILSWPTLPPQG
jgi:hypothetical protein